MNVNLESWFDYVDEKGDKTADNIHDTRHCQLLLETKQFVPCCLRIPPKSLEDSFVSLDGNIVQR
ncbi:MAG: hypothetical protein LBI18_07480 [Planctomycetaceae bacterium]|nr:hypothetical protein [Planctomycetaceae bacterium]